MQIDVILDARARAQELAELGQLAERCGINGVWVSSLLDSRDPFANLALLAHSTSRIRLGPIAVNPFDTHPVKIASALLTLNEMASGRARIVIGGGGEALQALDIRPARRVRAVRECVEIIRAAASGERVSYAGELFRVSNLQLRWLESAPPAVYVGASQQQMLRMAAACADGIMMSDMPPAPAAQAIATLDAALKSHGRQRPEFATNVFTAWHVYRDRQQALREARRWLLLRGIFRPWLLAEFLRSGRCRAGDGQRGRLCPGLRRRQPPRRGRARPGARHAGRQAHRVRFAGRSRAGDRQAAASCAMRDSAAWRCVCTPTRRRRSG